MVLATASLSRCGPSLLPRQGAASLFCNHSIPRQSRKHSTLVVRGSADADEPTPLAERLALPAAALLGAALLFAATPDEALAARSGGRVGGSSFSSRPRSAPRAVPRSSGPTYNNYSAPPLISPYGGGYGFGMPFFGGGIVAPFPMFGIGSIFNILIIMFILNVVLQTIRNFTSGDNKKPRDSWDDEDERW